MSDIDYEIEFWSKQIEQHCLFLYLGFIDEEYKNKAKQLENKWKNVNLYSKTRVEELIIDTIDYTSEAHDTTVNKKKWIGWILPALMKHMIDEEYYAYDKITGKVFTKAEELKFWNEHGNDVSVASIHLLDPTEKDAIEKAVKLSEKIEKLTPGKMYYFLSIQMAEQVNDFLILRYPNFHSFHFNIIKFLFLNDVDDSLFDQF